MGRTFLFTLLALLQGSVLAQSASITWGSETSVNTSATGYLRPRVALNAGQEPVVLWGDMGSMHNRVAVGNAGSFSLPIDLNPSAVMAAMADWMGADIAADGNSIWAVFKASPENANPMYGVNSIDGGFTWGDTIRIDPANDIWSRFPSVSTGPMGGPVVQYMQFDSAFANARYVVSRWMGGTFMPGVQVSTPFAPGLVCDCCPGQVVANGDDVIAMYRNNGSNVRTIWAAASQDGGATFPTGAEIDPTGWVINACPSSGPDGYVAGDSLRHVWMSGAMDGTKIYIGSAHLPDLTPGVTRRVHLGPPASVQQNYPRIAGSGDTLGVVWQQTAGGHSDVLFSWSVTGIAGLSVPDTVNSLTMGQRKTPDIAYANGTFHLAWSDQTADVIRYRTVGITSTVTAPEITAITDFHAWPSPARDRVFMDPGDLRPDGFHLIDGRGRVVLRSPGVARSLDTGDLKPGTYRLLAIDAAGRTIGGTSIILIK